jgi:hypothetical protein
MANIVKIVPKTITPAVVKIAGLVGPTGPAGATGSTGPTGPTGATGATGATGSTGAKGDKGDTGSQGIQGIKGDKGDTGDQGIQGIQGIQGEPGESISPEDTAFTVQGGTLGTQPTFNGAPLFTGSYVKTGDQVHFRIDVDMDNITNFGSGQYYLNLPLPSKYNYQFAAGCLHDISTGRDYPIFGHVLAGESQMVMKSIDAQGNSAFNVPFTPTSPFTLAVADNFHISGDYITE